MAVLVTAGALSVMASVAPAGRSQPRTVRVVPEPDTLLLMGSVLVGLGLVRRKRSTG